MRFKWSAIAIFMVLFVTFAYAGVTEMKIWCDEMMTPDSSKLNQTTGRPTRYGSVTSPQTFYVARVMTNEEFQWNYVNITSDDPKPAAGPYCLDFEMTGIPKATFWILMRRDDCSPGWSDPLDASATERVTFWIKGEKDNPPLWYRLDSFNGNYTTSVRVEGETVISQDQFGEYSCRQTLFNGQWQFVSIPWTFLMEKDSVTVWNTLPYSFALEGSWLDTNYGSAGEFTTDNISSMQWGTHVTDFEDQAELWGNPVYRAAPPNIYKWPAPELRWTTHKRYTVDEVVFTLNDGTGITDVDGKKTVMPLEYTMNQNYPNPFNPTTEIEYGIPVSNHVSIDIYNLMGQKVKTLVDRFATAGTYRIKWNGTDDNGRSVPSGVYVYKMSSSHYNCSKQMTLLK